MYPCVPKSVIGVNDGNELSNYRAAFEKISTIKYRPLTGDSVFDFHTAKLPIGQKWSRRTSGPSDYNPRDHRGPKQGIQGWMAYLNLIRTGFGAGMLGFSVAMSRAGIIFGSILAIFSALLIIHMHLVLLNCLNEISRRLKIPIISYGYGFRIALLHGPSITHTIGRCGPTIIAVFMILSQIGICASVIDFTSDTLRDIVDWQSTKKCMLCLLVPYLMLELFMKDLKIISYIALIGNILNVASLALMLYHMFLEPHEGELSTPDLDAFSLAFCFGTYLFNLSSVGVVLSLNKALENPSVMTNYFGVIILGMGIPAIISIIFGVLGYWSFGAVEEDVLKALPYDDTTSVIAATFFLLAVAFVYPIQCYPAIQIILEVIRNYSVYKEPSEETMRLAEKVARPAFVLLTFLTAYLFPIQALFVAFVGNLCTAMLALTFPALMEICLMYPGPYGKYNIYLVKDIIIMILGVVSFIFGAAEAGYILYLKVQISLSSPNDFEYV